MPKLGDILAWRYRNAILSIYKLRNVLTPPEFNMYTVFGSGRSGTSWLAEILADLSQSKILDEPLKRTNSHRIDKLGLVGWGQFIPEGEAGWTEMTKYVHRLYRMRELNPNHINTLENIFAQKSWVIKFIRANLLMPWLLKNVSIPKPVYIVRNPFAVIASQMNHPGWGLHREGVLTDKVDMSKFRYFDSFYRDYADLYDLVKTRVEFLAFIWILENKYVLNHPAHGDSWIPIRYEDLVLDPHVHLKHICQELEIDFSSDSLNFDKASYSTAPGEVKRNEQVEKWKSALTPKQIDSIASILEKGGMKQILFQSGI